MNNKEIIKNIENYINGESQICVLPSKGENNVENFRIATAQRLIRGYQLYKEDVQYKGDFYLALRDFLLVFNTDLVYDSEIEKDNGYGLVREGECIFARYDFSDDINLEFVKPVYEMSQIPRKESKNNLLTNAFIYDLTGFEKFKSPEQKLAVMGALKTPKGYTTLISLPTGGGKSLIAQTLAYQERGLTIVVIPTVSLAKDQMIAASHVLKNRDIENEVFEYSSGMPIQPIIKAIENETAKLLFVSPEALVKNQILSEAIKKANNRHYLRNIVIDEAHIVVEWGAFFRVDYQGLDPWRKALIYKNSDIRTFLMSATYDDYCVEVLKTLFSKDERWIEIRCDALRKEPRFIVLQEKNTLYKKKKIIELVKKLPHPMIVYVESPQRAENLKSLLEVEGIRNVKTFTGWTNNNQREKLIREWKDNRFEIIIATSAFGVGVDKPDVRTVLNLYVPPSPNAYYQELGRGGRDGLPCLSVMCVVQNDIQNTYQRVSKRVMTTEKILARWDSMFNNRDSKRVGEIACIDVMIRPRYDDQEKESLWEEDYISEGHIKWNVYVLLFLRRNGLIDIMHFDRTDKEFKISIKILDDILMESTEKMFSTIGINS